MELLSKTFLMRNLTIGQKLNYLKYKRSSKNIILNYAPITLSIQMTSRCNFSCDMCHGYSRKIPRSIYNHPGGKEIDFPTFKQFVDRFRNALTVSFIGQGEPFLNKDFFVMVEYAVFKRKMYTLTVTNGAIIGDKIDDILECGLGSIEISLNGHNAEEFNRMTGQPKKYYSIICDNIRTLVDERNERKSKLKISLSFILDQQNYKNIFQMMDVTEKFKVDEITFHNFLPSPVPGFTAEERCLYYQDQDVVKTLSQLKHTNYRIKINYPRLLDKSRKEKYCTDYFEILRVDGEGNVGGCTGQLLNLSGNGKFYDKDVWNNSHFQERRRLFLDPSLPDLPLCKVCWANNKRLILC